LELHETELSSAVVLAAEALLSENRHLFDLSGFTDLFAIVADRAQAVMEFG
jgi:hypothetical protein